MEASHSQYLEERLEAVTAELAQARKACEMHMRRCDMLEVELRRERALREGGAVTDLASPPAAAEAPSAALAASAAPQAPPSSATLGLGVSRLASTSLGAAAALLPPMGPSPSPSPSLGATAPNAALARMESKTNARLEGLEDSIEALIEAQRTLPLPSAAGDRVARQPMTVRLPAGTTLSAQPPPSAPEQVTINRGGDEDFNQ